MKTLLIAAALTALLAGCASSPVPTDQAEHIPPEQIINKAMFTPATDRGRVTINRDDTLGLPCSTKVMVNGIYVADIHKGEKATMHFPEGRHIISVKNNGICSGSGLAETEVSVARETPKTYRITFSRNGSIGIQPTAF